MILSVLEYKDVIKNIIWTCKFIQTSLVFRLIRMNRMKTKDIRLKAKNRYTAYYRIQLKNDNIEKAIAILYHDGFDRPYEKSPLTGLLFGRPTICNLRYDSPFR